MQKNHIYIGAGDYYDGYLWCPTRHDELLVKINVENGQVDYVLSMHQPGDDEEDRFQKIVSIGEGRFLAFSAKRDKILRIDTIVGKIECYNFPDFDRSESGFANVMGTIIYGKKCFCLPGALNYLLEINYETMEMVCHKGIVDEIVASQGMLLQGYFGWGIIREQNILYAVGPLHNFLLEFYLDMGCYKLIELSNEEEEIGYTGITISKDKMYVVNRRGSIRIYDVKTRKFIEQLEVEAQYWWVEGCKDKILLIPRFDNAFAMYCEKTAVVELISYGKESHFLAEKSDQRIVRFVNNLGEKYYITSPQHNMLIIVEQETGHIQYIPIKYGESLLCHVSETNKGILRESEKYKNAIEVDLKSFLDGLWES